MRVSLSLVTWRSTTGWRRRQPSCVRFVIQGVATTPFLWGQRDVIQITNEKETKKTVLWNNRLELKYCTVPSDPLKDSPTLQLSKQTFLRSKGQDIVWFYRQQMFLGDMVNSQVSDPFMYHRDAVYHPVFPHRPCGIPCIPCISFGRNS